MADKRRSLGIPSGTVFDFAGVQAPYGYLLCYGQTVLIADYPALFNAIGTTYGGNGTTNFILPDCRGRVGVGKDNMGGSAAGRMTTAGAGVDGITLGANGGSQTHTLTTAQLASHNHTANNDTHSHTITGGNTGSQGNMQNSDCSANNANGVTQSNTHTHTINNNGSGLAHQNTQPSIILNKIIKI